MATSTSLRSTAIHSEIRGEFTTKEGTYRNVKASEHCRPSRQPLFGKELSPVQVSFVSCKGKDGLCEWIVFNSGKELYFYRFEGVGKIPDLKHPLDKRVYKAPTIPVCHDFNIMTRSPEHLDLVVGFSTGPLQYLSPLEKHAICAFNEDASIDNTRVTCVKWVPGSEHSFVSSHRSGNLYVWSTENHATSKVTTPTNYVLHKEVLDAKVYHVKQRNKSPLLSRWAVGHGPINAFAFSPDCIHIAISSQDGFLRIYDFQKQEIYGRMRSYFGGLLCVCWSPDGKYTVSGGEDDLVTVWSFEHKKVVARGEGHKSYVNAVAFDPHMTVLPNSEAASKGGAARELPSVQTQAQASSSSENLESESRSTLEAGGSYVGGHHLSEKAATLDNYTAYRLGSIGQDTQICLWDLSGDILKIRRLIARGRSRMSRQSRPVSIVDPGTDVTSATTPKEAVSPEGNHVDEKPAAGREPSLVPNHFGSDSNLANHLPPGVTPNQNPEMSLPVDLLRKEASPSVSVSSSSSASSKKGKKHKKDKPKKDKPLKTHRSTLKDPMRKVIKFVGSGFTSNPSSNGRRSVGTFESCISDDIAPKMHEVNLVEPLVAKKISQERLTALVFREDCILTACHEGFISTWARPNVCMGDQDGTTTVADAGGGGSDGGGGAAGSSGLEQLSNSPSISGNPGINSPKPGVAMDHDPPPLSMKTTSI